MRGLPISLDEAAKIDGCGHMKIIFNIIVPLSTNYCNSLDLLFYYCME